MSHPYSTFTDPESMYRLHLTTHVLLWPRILTKRCLREMKLLLHLRGHAAIVTVLDAEIIYDEHGSFSEVC